MSAPRRVPIPTLETSRLRLRPAVLSDAPRIQAVFPHPNVVRYLNASIPWPYPEDGALQHLRAVLPRVEAGEEYLWAIELKGREDEGLIGLIGLAPEAEGDHRGFWLAEDHWGQGLMREAASAVNDFAFDVVGMDELRISNAAPNLASSRLKESVGAEVLGVEDRTFVGGTFPSVRWRLTAEAWRRRA